MSAEASVDYHEIELQKLRNKLDIVTTERDLLEVEVAELKRVKWRARLIALVVVMVCCLSPIFFLAHEVDGDEFRKALTGVVLTTVVGAVVATYKIWEGGTRG